MQPGSKGKTVVTRDRRLFGHAAVFALLVISLFSPQALPTEAWERRVDRVFASFDVANSPGCSVGIVNDGRFVYRRSYGRASLELDVPLTPASVFYIASVSKQFTAASVVLAAEQGFLSLDDDVRKYVPELPTYGSTITIRHMLHHTSGLRDVLVLLYTSGRYAEDLHSTDEFIDLIARQKALNFAPGSEFLYSNSNYFLLSVILKRATGKSLSRFAEENIFRPLGMTHTRFYDDHTLVVSGRIPAYDLRESGGFAVNWSTNFDKVGDGGLLSNLDDLLLWDRNFYNNRLGKGTLLQELQTPGVLNSGQPIEYALGLYMSSYRGLPIVEHSGSLFGYRAELLRFPEQRSSVICLCNVESANAEHLAREVADIYFEARFPNDLKARPAAEAVSTNNENTNIRDFEGDYYNSTDHLLVHLTTKGSDMMFPLDTLFKPVAPGRFAGPAGQQLTIERQDSGQVRILRTSSGVSRTYQRISPVKPTSAELTQYAGEYLSDELDARFKITAKDETLTVTRGWADPETLQPTIRDEFQLASGRSFVFRRNSEGRITGFQLFSSRVRNVVFDKNR